MQLYWRPVHWWLVCQVATVMHMMIYSISTYSSLKWKVILTVPLYLLDLSISQTLGKLMLLLKHQTQFQLRTSVLPKCCFLCFVFWHGIMKLQYGQKPYKAIRAHSLKLQQQVGFLSSLEEDVNPYRWHKSMFQQHDLTGTICCYCSCPHASVLLKAVFTNSTRGCRTAAWSWETAY